MTASQHPARLHLKLRELTQLFNSMDPSPFLDRDLDHDAEEFIVSWAAESPRAHGFELVVQLASPPDPLRATEVEEAVRHYFANRAEMKHRQFRLLLRRGHATLTVGLLFLSACLVASGLTRHWGDGAFADILREGLIIAGWVAMWRPLETYLYDWWPVREEWKTLRQLARMRVRLVPPAEAAKAAGLSLSGVPIP